jgi:hypothetical protein
LAGRYRPAIRCRLISKARRSVLDAAGIEIKNDSGNPIPVVTGLEIPEHDYIDLSYTGSNLTGVVYKTGGSGGTTVATLTLVYDGSDNLTSVTKS